MSNTGHDQALAALVDTRAAIAQIKKSAEDNRSGPDSYKLAAGRAVNALVGRGDPEYSATAGDPGDTDGAIGHLNALLHRPHSQPWDAAVHGAWVHAMVAVSQLRGALRSDDLDEFEVKMTDALQSLEMVIGRASDTDSLGGLQGAIANTVLGVPAGGKQVSGCSPPGDAPAYGVRDGHLLYMALPLRNAGVVLPQPAAVSKAVEVKGSYVIFRTPAYAQFTKLCAGSKAKTTGISSVSTNAVVAASDPPTASDPAPKLFTSAQAERGKAVFTHNCSSCHGDDLQGTSGPPNAGTDFLKKAEADGWTVGNLRQLVVDSMPLSNPGSLSAQQYADVLSYLLAASCYPSGAQQFPTKDTPTLEKIKLKPLVGVHVDNPKIGTCDVK